MATNGTHRKVTDYGASDEIVQWLESVTGLLAHVRSKYGSVAELLEDPGWDASQSRYAMALLNGLKRDISRITKEFTSHVEGYEKVVR
jgi:hypothetical protein